jgi:exonuclease III
MAATNFVDFELTVVSFNMHGYNQGLVTIEDLLKSNSPDVIMLQEHWLTPANLDRFNTDFHDYHAFGSSAMSKTVESGPLLGRPFGGTMILVKNELLDVCLCVDVSDRYLFIYFI